MVDLRQGLGWYLVAHALGVTAPPVLPAPALRALHPSPPFSPGLGLVNQPDRSPRYVLHVEPLAVSFALVLTLHPSQRPVMPIAVMSPRPRTLGAVHHVCGFFPTQFVILGLEIHDPLQRGPHERFLSRHSPSFPIPCTPSLPEPHSHTPGARAAPSAGSPASRTRLSCGTYEP